MTERESTSQSWVPEGTPVDKPNPARMYDYFLGGLHNFEIDRQAAEQVLKVFPEVRQVAQANRAFLRGAAKYLAEQGIDQFLDIGSGIPTRGNVHEIVQGINPEARVVYVDIDPIAVAHSRAILAGNPRATAIRADARDVELIVQHPEVQALLDFSRPVGLLLVAVLHFIPDDEEAYSLVRRFKSYLAPGSYVAISHGTGEGMPEEVKARALAIYARSTAPAKDRPRADFERFFEGLELVEPGIVPVSYWAKEISTDFPAAWCGIGRKP